MLDARPAVSVEHVSFSVGATAILRDVSLAAGARETTAILGPSGCGKTTLLRIIAGLERPQQGRVLFEGEDIGNVPPHRRGFGMMFQDFALFPHLNVRDNVGFGLRHSRLSRPARKERVAGLLELVGLARYETRTTESLSGGERQRVALARALAPEPRLLMLDEPLGSLDRTLRERLLVELRGILSRLGVPTIYVTHDQLEAFAVADRIAIMRAGRIVREGAPHEIYAEPRTEFVARFLGMDNIIHGERDGAGAVTTPLGRWCDLEGPPGPVRLLLRSDGARVAGSTGEGVVTGEIVSRLFQGQFTRLRLTTLAGELEFDLPGESPLPPEGNAVNIGVPRVQVLAPES
jgi:ABC-type Fe3+/spermidine/putrescine transport system ATPase subunit